MWVVHGFWRWQRCALFSWLLLWDILGGIVRASCDSFCHDNLSMWGFFKNNQITLLLSSSQLNKEAVININICILSCFEIFYYTLYIHMSQVESWDVFFALVCHHHLQCTTVHRTQGWAQCVLTVELFKLEAWGHWWCAAEWAQWHFFPSRTFRKCANCSSVLAKASGPITWLGGGHFWLLVTRLNPDQFVGYLRSMEKFEIWNYFQGVNKYNKYLYFQTSFSSYIRLVSTRWWPAFMSWNKIGPF